MAKRQVATRPMQGDNIVIERAEANSCHCGCGEEVNKNRKFKQGHDARLRGILGRAHRAGHGVIFKVEGKSEKATALAALKTYGFEEPPAPKPKAKKSAAKATSKKSRVQKSTRSKAKSKAA